MTELSPEHRAYLNDHAVPDSIIDELGIFSAMTRDELPPGFGHFPDGITPALCFKWTGANGAELWQVRPDDDEAAGKYLTAPGETMVLGVAPSMAARVADVATELVIVEGTKGHLSATAALAAEPLAAVVGITGCWGWSHDGLAVPCFNFIPWDGRHVVIAFDADRATNRHVYDAAKMLSEVVLARGAAGVRYVTVPANGTNGIDDYLASFPEAGRPAAMLGLLDRASTKIGRAPAKAKPARGAFFDDFGLLVEKLAAHLRAETPMALTGDGVIAVYDHELGLYRRNPLHLTAAVGRALGNDFRRTHLKDVENFLAGALLNEGLVLPTTVTTPLVNLVNGMLDLVTGELFEHDPKYLSHQQVPVEWDELAECPRYLEWAKTTIGDRLEELEELASQMLDRTRPPAKAGILYGPSRSGKSTYLRLLAAIAGLGNVSAVTLHQLAEDRFASASLYGRMLNIAADISAEHVKDLSLWKTLTGEDVIHGNRKYGNVFEFTNGALMMFSCNILPTVGEASSAYIERMRSFHFGQSFAGTEDRTIELGMLEELPGILRRLVEANRRLRARGAFLPPDPEERRRFETASNRVRRWIAEEMEVVPFVGGPNHAMPPGMASTKTELHRYFVTAADRDGEPRMGLHKFGQYLANMPEVKVCRRHPDKAPALNVVRRRPETEPDGPGEGFKPSPDGPEGGESSPQDSRPPAISEGFEGIATSTSRNAEQKNGGGEKYQRSIGGVGPKPSLSSLTPTALDLETCGEEELWRRGDFIRLAGWAENGSVELSTDVDRILELAAAGVPLAGHNLLGFDLLALGRYHGLDVLAVNAVDTMLVASLIDPPEARMSDGEAKRRYRLNAVAEKYLGAAKLPEDGGKLSMLERLRRRHGGYDRIPVDDPDYRDYLSHDVELVAGLLDHPAFAITPYIAREHRVAAVAAKMTLNGFAVDEALLAERLEAGRATRARCLEDLRALGLPTTRKDGSESSSPHATEAGKLAIAHAFAELGVKLPETAKGNVSISGETMRAIAAANPGAAALAETVAELVGVRSIYETINDNLVDGRVHPMVSMRQATGRWSVQRPGLTVMGKRGGRHVERHVLIAEPGHVLIAADLSQIDARAVAALSGDGAYLELFEPGRDVHSETAVRLWGDAGKRELAKVFVHGWSYGMQPAGLAARAGVSLDEALEFDQAMRSSFPTLVAWRRAVREQAASGELLDNGHGRKMRPDPFRGGTQPSALLGQGCARDLMCEGLLRLPAELLEGLRAVVHDELVVSVPAEHAVEAGRALVAAMSFEWAPADGSGAPVAVEAAVAGSGASWGACYEKGGS